MTPRHRPLRTGTLAFVAAAASLGCADDVRPTLGGLKIGPAGEGPFLVPHLIGDPSPFEYPDDAWRRGVGGETILRIHITVEGDVDTALVASSSGDRVLDSASVAAARSLRYRPARRGDMPVAVWAYLPVRYPMPGATSSESGSR